MLKKATVLMLLLMCISLVSFYVNAQITTIPAAAGTGSGTGDVTGPGSSVSGRIATFNGTTGKTIQDGGSLISDLVATTRTLVCSTGLTGCGNLSANRTLSLDINALTEKTSPVAGTDYALLYDVAGAAHKKALWPSNNGGMTCSLASNILTCSCPSYCYYGFGNGNLKNENSAAVVLKTASSSNSTGYLWVASDGTIQAQFVTGTTMTTSTGATVTTAASPTWPSDGTAVLLGTMGVTGNNIVTWTPTPMSGGFGGYKFVAGSNMTITPSGDNTLTFVASGGAATAGSGTELQYRVDASTLGAVTGSSVSGADVTLKGGGLSINNGSASLRFQASTNGADNGQIVLRDNATRVVYLENRATAATITGGDSQTLQVAQSVGSAGVMISPYGYVRWVPQVSKPTCDSNMRGAVWQTNGGAGVKDDFQVCTKDAADAYAWRTIY